MQRIQKAIVSCKEYRKDVKLYNPEQDTTTKAVDMQKVIMLPHMHGVKWAILPNELLLST